MYTKKVLDGYYYVNMTYDKRLAYCPYGSCGVIFHNDGGVSLISYATRVITIDGNGFLTCTGTYSTTTRKHIGAFLKEYAPMLNYYNAKHCFENCVAMNIETGEIINV